MHAALIFISLIIAVNHAQSDPGFLVTSFYNPSPSPSIVTAGCSTSVSSIRGYTWQEQKCTQISPDPYPYWGKIECQSGKASFYRCSDSSWYVFSFCDNSNCDSKNCVKTGEQDTGCQADQLISGLYNSAFCNKELPFVRNAPIMKSYMNKCLVGDPIGISVYVPDFCLPITSTSAMKLVCIEDGYGIELYSNMGCAGSYDTMVSKKNCSGTSHYSCNLAVRSLCGSPLILPQLSITEIYGVSVGGGAAGVIGIIAAILLIGKRIKRRKMKKLEASPSSLRRSTTTSEGTVESESEIASSRSIILQDVSTAKIQSEERAADAIYRAQERRRALQSNRGRRGGRSTQGTRMADRRPGHATRS